MVMIFDFDHITDENRECNPLKSTQMSSFIIETSWVLPRKYSKIFVKFGKMFENDHLAFGQLLDNLRKSLEMVEKSRQFMAACR